MVEGCFHWYLFRSGGFVTGIAYAIQAADSTNLEKLRRIYPQMVAAFEMPNDWDTPPSGFSSNVYDALPTQST